MKTVLSGVCVLLLLSPVAALAQEKAQPKGDAKAIQGTWKIVSCEEKGQPEQRMVGMVLTLRGGKLIAKHGDKTLDATYKLTTTKTPHWLDITFQAGDGNEVTIQAIYELKGDTLRICHGTPGAADRPTRLVSEDTPANQILATLKRQKD